ncbi:sensor domain-containing diguanylate cyclase [Deinococcus misasensis]|uniref:sensor domain-containing diguanylate cyclase n=1 Tax=Deinococcus misasensis TaxID=392413 RepID=UPI000557FF4D|nr:diguanylate cyclase [Deinococcus misasensis]
MQPHKDNPIEQHRVHRLQAYSILDTPREAEFDQLLDDLVFIMEADGAYLSFMDGQRQWFKSAVGMNWTEIPIQQALCSSTLHTHTPLMVFDVHQDCTYSHSPLVQQAPHIKAFLALPLRATDGTGIGTLCVFSQQPRIWTVRDTEILRRYTSKTMHLLEKRLQGPSLSEEMNAIMQYGSDGLILLDSTEHILDFNPLAQSITGLQWVKGEEFSTSLFLHDDSIPEIHKGNVFMRWDGQVWFKVTAAPLDRQDGILLIIEDVTHHLQHQFGLEAKVYQEQTREEGEKNALYEYLQGRIQDHNCSVVYLDLDDFRSINDQHGFQAGDTLLRQVAIRLRQSLRGNDRVYRLSRDEFILVLAGDLDPDILAMIASRVQHNLQKPFQLDFQEVRITASLGLTSTAPSEHVDAVLQRAESLMQQSKQQGKGQFCVGVTPE